jgi:hypothetical protein
MILIVGESVEHFLHQILNGHKEDELEKPGKEERPFPPL